MNKISKSEFRHLYIVLVFRYKLAQSCTLRRSTVVQMYKQKKFTTRILFKSSHINLCFRFVVGATYTHTLQLVSSAWHKTYQ